MNLIVSFPVFPCLLYEFSAGIFARGKWAVGHLFISEFGISPKLGLYSTILFDFDMLFTISFNSCFFCFSGIKEVIYFSDKHKDKDTMIASRKLLDLAAVNYRQHIPKHEKIEIDFGYINRKYIGRSEEKK